MNEVKLTVLTVVYYKWNGDYEADCGNCKRTLSSNVGDMDLDEVKFCPFCGAKINNVVWELEEEEK